MEISFTVNTDTMKNGFCEYTAEDIERFMYFIKFVDTDHNGVIANEFCVWYLLQKYINTYKTAEQIKEAVNPLGKSRKWVKGLFPEEKSILYQIRGLPKYQTWRNAVLEQDCNICRICETKDNLQVHHIKRLKELVQKHNIKTIETAIDCDELWNVENGITLCKKCHTDTLGKESWFEDFLNSFREL